MNKIDFFKFIRDIPYKIPPTFEETDYSCGGKHDMFTVLLKSLGFKVRDRMCNFLWGDLNLPKELLDIPHEDLCTHVYLEVFINNKWVIVDATWDKGLSKVFHVNEWDGENDTKIAVPSKTIFSPEKSLEISKKESEKDFIVRDLKINGRFYQAFNKWLEEIRKKYE